MADVTVTPDAMYALLLELRDDVRELRVTSEREHDDQQDHERRLRELESREDLSRRLDKVEGDMRSVQVRIWSFPTLAGLVAVSALLAAIANYLP